MDITYNQVNWALKWGLTGVIEELTPYFAKGPRSKEDYFAGELVNWSWGPNLYGVPFQSGGECFHINKDLCSRKAGVEIPPPDWSYDDLLEISRKLTNEDEKQWATGDLPELRVLHDGHVDVQLWRSDPQRDQGQGAVRHGSCVFGRRPVQY